MWVIVNKYGGLILCGKKWSICVLLWYDLFFVCVFYICLFWKLCKWLKYCINWCLNFFKNKGYLFNVICYLIKVDLYKYFGFFLFIN